MQESLATEHSRELLRDSLEQLLDGGAVTDEGAGHLESAWWNVAYSRLHVIWDPFDKVAAVFVLYIQHLLVHFLHGHAAAKNSGDSEVTAVTRIAGGHHVLGIEHLLGEFRYRESAVLLAPSGGERSKTWHEEVKTWERHHVDGQFAKIGIQLTRETQACCDARHRSGDEMVQVPVGGRGQFQGTETDVVESLVINTVGLVCVFHQLMHGEGGIVGFDNCV